MLLSGNTQITAEPDMTALFIQQVGAGVKPGGSPFFSRLGARENGYTVTLAVPYALPRRIRRCWRACGTVVHTDGKGLLDDQWSKCAHFFYTSGRGDRQGEEERHHKLYLLSSSPCRNNTPGGGCLLQGGDSMRAKTGMCRKRSGLWQINVIGAGSRYFLSTSSRTFDPSA